MMADLLVIALGALVVCLGIVCAVCEERQWTILEDTEPTRAVRLLHERLGTWMFDCYRAAAVAGGVALVVGIANLLIPVATAGTATHVSNTITVPIGVSWSWKVGLVFLLWVRAARLWSHV